MLSRQFVSFWFDRSFSPLFCSYSNVFFEYNFFVVWWPWLVTFNIICLGLTHKIVILFTLKPENQLEMFLSFFSRIFARKKLFSVSHLKLYEEKFLWFARSKKFHLISNVCIFNFTSQQSRDMTGQHQYHIISLFSPLTHIDWLISSNSLSLTLGSTENYFYNFIMSVFVNMIACALQKRKQQLFFSIDFP